MAVDPVRELIEEARELARKERMQAPMRSVRYNALADALESQVAETQRLREGIKAVLERYESRTVSGVSRVDAVARLRSVLGDDKDGNR